MVSTLDLDLRFLASILGFTMRFSGLFNVEFYLSMLIDLNCSITNSNLKIAQFVS